MALYFVEKPAKEGDGLSREPPPRHERPLESKRPTDDAAVLLLEWGAGGDGGAERREARRREPAPIAHDAEAATRFVAECGRVYERTRTAE